GLALLGRGRALFDRGGLQELLDRLRCGRRRRLLCPALLRLRGNRKTRLFRHLWCKQRVGGKARHQEKDAGAEQCTENFIEFEGVHFGSGSGPEGDMESGRGPPEKRKESDFVNPIPKRKRRYRFARSLATRINGPNSNNPHQSLTLSAGS